MTSLQSTVRVADTASSDFDEDLAFVGLLDVNVFDSPGRVWTLEYDGFGGLGDLWCHHSHLFPVTRFQDVKYRGERYEQRELEMSFKMWCYLYLELERSLSPLRVIIKPRSVDVAGPLHVKAGL